MTTCRPARSRLLSLFWTLLLTLNAPRLRGQPAPASISTFNSYTRAVEARLAGQHRSSSFLVGLDGGALLRSGELSIEKITPTATGDLPGALLHHWRGTAFAPGPTAADFERLMRDFKSYPLHFAPQVLAADVVRQDGDRMEASMRIRQRHVITVVMDATYDVRFGRLDRQHGYSISQSERIAEIAAPGTPGEHALTAAEEHGFLWRLNTYWSYEERDGGLYLQIEAVSLTRAIPRGLGWAVGPYVESIPRESLEFTLRSACSALSHAAAAANPLIAMQPR